MKFREIFRYELSYRLRSPLTWIYFGVVWLGTLFIVHMTSAENNRVVNAPLHHAEIIAMLGVFLMVVTAGIFGDSATRDSDTRMHSLFSTAPISKLDYLGGRFAASLLVNAGVIIGMPLMVALSMTFPWLSKFNWAPFQVMAFLQPFVLLSLPNLFISAAVIYTIAALTKNALATYLGAVGLAVLYLIVVNQGMGNDTVKNLVDPFAIGALQRVTSFWTPSEQTSRLIGFPGIIVLNRVLWMTLAGGLLLFMYRKFSFTHPGLRGGRRSVQAPGAESDEPVRHAITSVRDARRVFDGRARWVQLLEVARHALLDIVRNRVFLLLVAGSVFLAAMVGWEVGAIVFDTSTWPVTHLMAGSLNGVFIALIMVVVISLIAGELVWKEREVGAADITAAAPVSDWIPLVGRFLALVAVLVMLQALYTVTGIAIQAVQGYYNFELGLYVKIMFGLQLLDYVILAALAMAVHVVVNQKNLGHAIVVASYAFTLVAGGLFRIRHNLLVYNGDSGWVYSDMAGFGPFIGPWLWFKAYWGAWALLLAVIATVFWVRSTEGGLRARMRLARLRMAGAAGRAAALAGLLIITTGGFVFYNTNLLNDFVTPEESRARRIAYERRFKQYQNAPQPTIVRNTLRVDIWPERRAVEMRGSYRMVNASGKPVSTLLVSTSPDMTLDSVRFDRPATMTLHDADARQLVYTIPRGLAPGDSLTMEFALSSAPRGFTNGRVPTTVVANGAYLNRGWLPALGYQPSRELTDTNWRRKAGLGPRPQPSSPRDTTAAAFLALADDGTSYVDMDVIIGTAEDQIAVTPGRLVREWSGNGRRWFHYVTDEPVPHGAAMLSARYAVHEGEWRGLPMKVFYHPAHTFNLDRILASMQAALEYNSANFGPYPYGELRVVEFPRYSSNATAHPHTIAFGEGSAFITRIEDDDVDRTFFVVAHETAHMWWGNTLRGARLKGVGLVSETLASYSAMMAMEKHYGADMARRFFDFEMERYLRGRRRFSSREVPLVEVFDQSHLFYNKGAVAMYTMRDMVGEETVSRGLRRFYMKHAKQGPPYPTSLDLVSELRAVTPDSLKYFVTDLFETITLWDVKTSSAAAKQVGDSAWEVTLTVTAKKLRADSMGVETEVPMNDLVEIGVFGERKNDYRGPALYSGKHWIRSGTQTITVTVDREPAQAGIDPDRKLIDRDQGWRLKNVTMP